MPEVLGRLDEQRTTEEGTQRGVLQTSNSLRTVSPPFEPLLASYTSLLAVSTPFGPGHPVLGQDVGQVAS